MKILLRLPLLATVAAAVACNEGPEVAGRVEHAGVVQSPIVSPLILLGDSAGARSTQGFAAPDVAYGGGVYLVVWSGGSPSTTAPLSAAWVGADGRLIDPQPTVTVRNADNGAHVAFDGTNFHLLWRDGAMIVVSPSGQVVVAPKTLQFSGLNFFGFAQDLGCSASNCAAILYNYDESGTTYVVSIARLSLTGDPLDSLPIEVANSGNPAQWMSRVVATPTGYFAAWTDENWAVRGVALDATGTPVGSAAVVSMPPTTTDRFVDSIASNGSELLLVREQDVTLSSPSLTPQCYGQRLGFDGSALDTMLNSYTTGAPCAVVASDGDTFLVTDRTASDVLAAEIATTGAVGNVVTTGGPSGLNASVQFPAMASDGQHYLQAWTPTLGVQTTLLDTHGTVVVPPTDVAFDPLTFTPPAAASNGGAFLAVWSDDRASGTDGVYGTRVGLDGTVLARALPLAPNANVDASSNPAHGSPAVASNGSGYLVAWPVAAHGIDATLVAGDGSASPSFHVSGTSVALAPAVASNGSAYLVSWIDPRNLVSDVFVARVDAMGTVVDSSGVRVATASSALGDTVFPRVASTGNGYALAWRHRLATSTSTQDQDDVQLAVLSDSATTVTAPAAVSVGQTDVDNVDLACGPTTCLVAWTSGGMVWVRRVDPNGSPLASPASVAGALAAPRVAWDGVEFVLTSLDSSANTARWIAVDGSMTAPKSSLATDAGVANGVSNYALASNGAGVDLVVESVAGHVYGLRVTNDLAPPPDGGPIVGPDANGGGVADAAIADAAAAEGSAAGVEAGSGAVDDASSTGDAPSAGDASSSSAGSSSGNGSSSAPPESGKSGCGCAAAGSRPPLSSIAAAAFALLLGARRRTARSRDYSPVRQRPT